MSSTDAQYITLQAWAARKFDPVPSARTLSRWVESGMIVPAPFKIGRQYMVLPTARHRDEPATRLVDRLRHGLASA